MKLRKGIQEGGFWWTVSLLCPQEREEDFASAFRELAGAPVCCQPQGRVVQVWTCLPEEPKPGSLHDWEESLSGLALALGSPPPELQITAVNEEDWLESWKRFFTPLIVRDRLVVRPPWFSSDGWGRREQVVIRPGLAFGTGLHSTTKMCLEFLADVLSEGKTVLDVGTGSGILSIAACKLGAGAAVAVDNDLFALRECRKNCLENGVGVQVLVLGGYLLTALRWRWNLIVCNIDAVHAFEVAHRVADYLEPDGRLVLTGFTAEKEEEVKSALAEGILEVEERRQEGPWICLLARECGSV